MITYIVDCTTRKNDRDCTLGPFVEFDRARKEAAEWLRITEDDWKTHTEYGSSFEAGTYFDCEVGVEIFKRELK